MDSFKLKRCHPKVKAPVNSFNHFTTNIKKNIYFLIQFVPKYTNRHTSQIHKPQTWDQSHSFLFCWAQCDKHSQSWEADLDRDLERDAECLAGDLDSRWSSCRGDFATCFSLLLAERDRERLLDLLLVDFSLERLRDLRLGLTLDLLLERDLRVSDRERDFLLLEGLWGFSGDLERDFFFDLERDFPDLEWDRRLLRDRELQREEIYETADHVNGTFQQLGCKTPTIPPNKIKYVMGLLLPISNKQLHQLKQ